MNVLMATFGIFNVLVGGALVRSPHRVRNFVPSETWQENPHRAKREQEVTAKALGVAVAVVGGGFVVASIVM